MSTLPSPRPSARRSGRGGERRRLAGAALAVATVLAVVTLVPAPGGAQGAPEPAVAPASAVRTDTEVPDLAVVPAAEAPAPPVDGAPEVAGGDRLVTAEEEVAEFTVIGAGYRSPSGGEGQVRVRSEGGWGPWTELHLDVSHGADSTGPEGARRARPTAPGRR